VDSSCGSRGWRTGPEARSRFRRVGGGLFLVLLALCKPLAAQELEPRALQNAPVGMNFAILAAGYSRGNVLFDPTLPLEDVRADVWSTTLGFVRAIDVFGMSGRAGVLVPLVSGDWSGRLAGADTATSRTGVADPRILLAVNLIGAPALRMSQMRGYRQTTTVGVQLQVAVPLGQYYPDKLINLGSNRWAFESRLGISHAVGARWIFEGYGGATFYTRNGEFIGGTELTQDPFFEAEGDVIYLIRRPDIWFAASIGYGWGGTATVGSVEKEPLSNVRASGVLRLPIAPGHGLKLVYITGLTTKLGADFDTVQLGYQYTFGGKP